MVLVASLHELSRPSSPSGLLHDWFCVLTANDHETPCENIFAGVQRCSFIV